MLQRHAIQKFHGDERLAVLLANVVDGANVGMVQRRSRLRFTPKAFQRLSVVGHIFGQKLEGYEAVQPGILGLIHHTHATAAELVDDVIVRNSAAKH